MFKGAQEAYYLLWVWGYLWSFCIAGWCPQSPLGWETSIWGACGCQMQLAKAMCLNSFRVTLGFSISSLNHWNKTLPCAWLSLSLRCHYIQSLILSLLLKAHLGTWKQLRSAAIWPLTLEEKVLSVNFYFMCVGILLVCMSVTTSIPGVCGGQKRTEPLVPEPGTRVPGDCEPPSNPGPLEEQQPLNHWASSSATGF